MTNNQFDELHPSPKAFEQVVEGKDVSLFILKNEQMSVSITNYGARIVSIVVPDMKETLKDVVLGFDNLEGYMTGDETYFGATIGRYGNRIANGKFTLEGETYTLPVNNGPNHLHGGLKGFSRVVWDVERVSDEAVELSYFSKDGEEGYPGDLNVKVTFTLTKENEVKIEYKASTTKPTVINLTNHSFFNLNGLGTGTIYNHSLQVNADHYVPVNENLIPYGQTHTVESTPFDFRIAKTIGKDIFDEHEQLKFGNGYDHTFAFENSGALSKVSTALGDQSGIVMDTYTSEPGMQLYTGNFLESNHTLKNGSKDEFRGAFCLETQHFPDSPNQSSFPSAVLQPDGMYESVTIYKFSVNK